VSAKARDLIFNLVDSEYSFSTGNLEEFVQERFAILDVLYDWPSDDVADFFVDRFSQDIAIAYGLGVDQCEVLIPQDVYKRRLLTNKLFVDSVEISSGKATFAGKNPFNLLSDETAQRIEEFFEELKINQKTHILKGFYFETYQEEENMEDDDFKEEEKNSILIITKASNPRDAEENATQNLARYNDLQELLKTKEKQLDHATSKFDAVYKCQTLTLSRNNSRTKESTPHSITYTAKILIRNESKHLEKGALLTRLKSWRSDGMLKLEQLHDLQLKAIRSLQFQTGSVLTQMPLTKVEDLLGIISRCQELERKVVLECVKEDLQKSEYTSEIIGLNSNLEFFLNEKTYKQCNSEGIDRYSAEAFFNERIDKIKKTIYSNYYKSRQIHRHIWHMKKKAQK
jgi:hypothetical protein